MNKKLIYYTVKYCEFKIDDLDYWEYLTINSIKSLLEFGKFDGDIVILCDSKLSFANFNNYKNITVIKCLDDVYVYHARTNIMDYLDISGYSHVMCLDSDTLIINDVTKLFANNDTLLLFAYFSKKLSNMTSDAYKLYSYFLSPEEQIRLADKLQINGGHFVVPNKLFASFYSIYQKLCKNLDFYGVDQSALNFISYYDLCPQTICSNLVRYDVFIPGLYDDIINENEVIIVHFLGTNHTKNLYINYCKQLNFNISINFQYGLYLPNEFLDRKRDEIYFTDSTYYFGKYNETLDENNNWGKLKFKNDINNLEIITDEEFFFSKTIYIDKILLVLNDYGDLHFALISCNGVLITFHESRYYVKLVEAKSATTQPLQIM